MDHRIELSKSELFENKDASALQTFTDEAFQLMKQHKTEFIGAAVVAGVAAGVVGMRALNRMANEASLAAGGMPYGALSKNLWGETNAKFALSSHNPLLARERGFDGVINPTDVLAHELPHKFTTSAVKTMEASPASRFLPPDILSVMIERSTGKLETSAGSRELAEKLVGSPSNRLMHIKHLRISDDGADVIRGTTNFSERLPNKDHHITFLRNHDDPPPVTTRVFGNFLDKSGLEATQGFAIWKDALTGMTTRDGLPQFAQATVNSATRMLNPRIGEVGISEAENHALHLQKAWKEVGIDTKLTTNH